LQLLHAWETTGHRDLAAAAAGVVGLTGATPGVAEKAQALAEGVIAESTELDREIGEAAEHWRLDRLGWVDRNILRLAVFELRHELAPPRVVIDEALWLAHRFAGPRSPGFINGVLDRVARALGRL
jgi:N utilization substance protein B